MERKTFIGSDGRRYVKRTSQKPKLYWSRDQLEMLTRRYSTVSVIELAELIGYSDQTIRRKAKELGLKKHPDYRRRANNRNLVMANFISKLRGNKGWIKQGERRGRSAEYKSQYLVQRLDTGYIALTGEVAKQLGGNVTNVLKCARLGYRFRGVYLKIYEQLNTKKQ